MKLGLSYKLKRIWKDLWIHILLSIMVLLVICKFSSAPAYGMFANALLLRPVEGTVTYEFFRVLENLGLAYLASFVFYLIVTYIPMRKLEYNSIKLATSHIRSAQMWMSRTVNYLSYKLDIQNIENCSETRKKEIEDFSFPDYPEFLFVVDTQRDQKNTGYVDPYNGRDWTIRAGRGIQNELNSIYSLVGNGAKLPDEIQLLLTKIRTCGFLQKITEILPTDEPMIDGVKYKTTFLDFYADLCEFVYLEAELKKYVFPIEGLAFRKATEEEIQNWVKQQIEIRKANPHIDELVRQLTKS